LNEAANGAEIQLIVSLRPKIPVEQKAGCQY
jgi:hypothetical protein